MLFDGLTRIGRDGKVELALAEHVDVSDDGCTYRFFLREATWSSGQPVTAADFVYAWRTVLSPDFLTPQASFLYVIKNGRLAKEGKVDPSSIGVIAVSDHLLEVVLEYPVPHFLELLAQPVFFPVCAEVDRTTPHWASSPSLYVSCGPFRLAAWSHSGEIVVKKNPLYWDASSVKLSQIDLVMVGELSELQMYENRQLDWAGSPLSVLPIDALDHLKGSRELNVKPFLATYFFRCNVQRFPLHHLLMRKALSLAIRREEITEYVLCGGQMPAWGLAPPAMGIEAQSVSGNSRECFEEALREMGVDKEACPAITLIYIAGGKNHPIAQTVQRQWEEALGIEVRLEPLERKVYLDRLSRGDYMLAASSWTADFDDPLTFFEVFKFASGGTNNTGWENSDYRHILDKAVTVADPVERNRLLAACHAILAEELPVIPVFHYTQLYVKSERVRDVALTNLGSIDFKWAYLDSDTSSSPSF
jgi:oligopeptide transport system substrate-binding protein